MPMAAGHVQDVAQRFLRQVERQLARVEAGGEGREPVGFEGQHIAQAAAGARRLGVEGLEREFESIDPQRAVTVPSRTDRVPAVAGNEQDLPGRQVLLFARNPIERVLSTYYFWRNQHAPGSASTTLYQARNFYGTVTVADQRKAGTAEADKRIFYSGQVVHGVQFLQRRIVAPCAYHNNAIGTFGAEQMGMPIVAGNGGAGKQ